MENHEWSKILSFLQTGKLGCSCQVVLVDDVGFWGGDRGLYPPRQSGQQECHAGDSSLWVPSPSGVTWRGPGLGCTQQVTAEEL